MGKLSLQLQTPRLRLYTRSCLTWVLFTHSQMVFGALGILYIYISIICQLYHYMYIYIYIYIERDRIKYIIYNDNDVYIYIYISLTMYIYILSIYPFSILYVYDNMSIDYT